MEPALERDQVHARRGIGRACACAAPARTSAIEVSDSGDGIPADFLPHVFERFRQADSGSRRRYGGLGLGLSIVRHLVELHGGTVSADSAGEGQGSTFRVLLPVADSAESLVPEPRTPEPPIPDFRPPTSDLRYPPPMERKTAHHFEQELLNIFDQFVHGDIDRRGFLDRAGKFAVGGVTAGMLLDMLSPQFAAAQQVPKDDKRLKAEYVEYPSPQGNTGKTKGYLVRPAKATGKLPAILVIHENRGLNPHIEDIARRLALDNFMAFAPDALAPLGGYPVTKTRRARCSRSSTPRRRARTSSPPRNWLKSRPDSHRQGRRGRLLLGRRDGEHPRDPRCPISPPACPSTARRRPPRKSPRSRRRSLIQYAGNDERVNATWPAIRGRAEGRQRAVRDAHVHGRAARLQQRHDAALRRRRGQAGVDAHRGVLQEASRLAPLGSWRAACPLQEIRSSEIEEKRLLVS